MKIVGALIVLFISTLCLADAIQKNKEIELNDSSTIHSDEGEIRASKKHKFEREFAQQCVEREIKNSINKDNDRKRFKKPCLCIATRMMKDLTTDEAEKFIAEQKNTQSLRMSFDEAAFFCLQNKPKPKSPTLFGKK